MTMISRSHRSHAAAHASAGMTWLLNSATATDARQRTGPCWHDMAAELLVTAAIDACRRTGSCWHDMAA